MKRRVVESKEQLIEMLTELQSSNLEKDTASSYIDALAAWLNDCDGFYTNIGEVRDTNVADWQLIADALIVATVYD